MDQERPDSHEPHGESDFEGEEQGDHSDGGGGKGKGGKKPTISAQARRDQNRIAQREFRMRRQQHIKDLEARIELLSGDRDERQEAFNLLIKNLLAENAQLRKLVKDLSGFIGEGLATCLPRLGLTLESLDAFIDRPERAPAHEAMAALKEARLKASGTNRDTREANTYDTIFGGAGAGRGEEAGPSGSAAGPSRKRASEGYPGDHGGKGGLNGAGAAGGAGGGGGPKRAKTHDVPLSRTSSNQSHPESPPAYDPLSRRYNRPHAQSVPNASTSVPNNMQDYTTGALAGLPDPSSSLPQHQPQNQPQAQASPVRPTEAELMEAQQAQALQRTMMRAMENAEGRQQEAMQLIGYHLTNYRQNPNYFLPPSLRPTLVQKSIPHEHLIDGLIFPSLRDKMILMRGKYNLIEAFDGLMDHFSIPGEDTLDHRSWEISEIWFRKNPFLLDMEALSITNNWRQKRGEPPLTREILLQPLD